jgi:hypothetical protein
LKAIWHSIDFMKGSQESQPMTTSERQERQGQFPSECEKMFFTGSNFNAASTSVFAVTSPGIHSCVSQDPTRATHRLIIDDRFGQHCLSASPMLNVEEILKKSKTHRCAMDFDRSFRKAVFCNDSWENAGDASTPSS